MTFFYDLETDHKPMQQEDAMHVCRRACQRTGIDVVLNEGTFTRPQSTVFNYPV
jgi:hypothetical protein